MACSAQISCFTCFVLGPCAAVAESEVVGVPVTPQTHLHHLVPVPVPYCRTRFCLSAIGANHCNWILITQLSKRLFLFLCLLMQLFSCPILALTLQEEGIFQSA